MATPADRPLNPVSSGSSAGNHVRCPSAHPIANWGYNLNVAGREQPLDYAVISEGSAFPAGWVRFDNSLAAYVFSSLLPGRQIPAAAHADPEQAVPAWVGAYALKAIHPIPEDVTGDMLTAAPAMLALLKQLRTILIQEESRLPGLDLGDLDHVLDIADGRG